MNALKLVEDIHAHGGTLELTDGKLIARNIPAGMLKQLRLVKPAILELLAANDEPRPTTTITNNHVAHGGVSVVMRTNEGAVEYAALIAQGVGYAEAFSRATSFEDALQAFVGCGWTGVTAENVARAIADGTTDETVLTAMLEATQ